MEERLQKYLDNNGIAARRKCEEYILAGRVKVNGKIVTELGTKIKPEKIPEIIKDGDRKKSGKTLPPSGLFLMKVMY